MNAVTKRDALLRQIIAVCEIQLGSRVTVAPTAKYSSEWEGRIRRGPHGLGLPGHPAADVYGR